MDLNIVWHPKFKNVLLMTIEGDPTLEELLELTRREGEMITTAGRVVDTVIDVSKLNKIPQGFLGIMPKIGSMPAAKHPHAGRKIVCGATGLGGLLLDIFSKLYHKLYFFSSLAAAESFLAQSPGEQP